MSRDDFAPALLDLQDHPPARLPGVVLYTIAGLSACLLLWALVGRLDVVASAEGRLVPQTYVKIVQPADAGVVQEILVSEGQSVQAGQVLMRLDPQLMQADSRTLAHELSMRRLQLKRIDAELTDTPLHAEPADPSDAYGQVLQQLQARQQAYRDALAMEQATHEKASHDLEAARQELLKLQQTLSTYGRSAMAYDRLGIEGFYSPLAVEEKRREWVEKQQDLRSQEALVAAASSSLEASKRKLAQITSTYRSDLHNERLEAQNQLRRLEQEVRKLDHKTGWLALKAPQAGVIKDLATHTVGTVVSAGTVLMSLVPHDEPLQAEVYVKNEDAGFVREGQAVKVKVAAYPFQKYGMLDGTVQHLGPDALDPGQQAAGQAAISRAADAAVTPRYKALVSLQRQQLEMEGQAMPLSPGMQVVGEVHLGARTVMEYLLSPVQKAWHEAGRER